MEKRVMTPAVDEMTVKEERACLSEIREKNTDISYTHILHNGWTAGHFALKYVTGHYRKRKSKEKHTQADGCCDHDHGSLSDTAARHVKECTYLSNPFSARPDSQKDAHAKQTKRTQRYRSTAKSRILGMTVGDIRFCFQQLRNAGDTLTAELVLYNGECAGQFALCYLIETSNSMRNRRKRETNLARHESSAGRAESYPPSQLPQTRPRQGERSGSVTFVTF